MINWFKSKEQVLKEKNEKEQKKLLEKLDLEFIVKDECHKLNESHSKIFIIHKDEVLYVKNFMLEKDYKDDYNIKMVCIASDTPRGLVRVLNYSYLKLIYSLDYIQECKNKFLRYQDQLEIIKTKI